MKKLSLILVVLLGLFAAYYMVWRANLSGDVARVEATIAHHNAEFRKNNRWVTFKADSLSRAGFPFASRVYVKRPTLTFVANDETYGVSLPWVELSLRDSKSGTYTVTYPQSFQALFAKSGLAPEEYTVTLQQPMAVLVRAQGDSRLCSFLPGGQRCAAVGPADPLISFAVQFPETLLVDMALNGRSKTAKFNVIPLDIPIFRLVPKEADHALQLFVGMLREALIFQKN